MLRNLKKSEETGENTVLFAWGGQPYGGVSPSGAARGGGSALTPTGGLPGRVEERVGGGRWVGSTASWRGSTGKRKRIRAQKLQEILLLGACWCLEPPRARFARHWNPYESF